MSSEAPRVLNDDLLAQLRIDIDHGTYDPYLISCLLETVDIQREVLKTLFGCYRRDTSPFCTADTLRRTTFDTLARMVGMEQFIR